MKVRFDAPSALSVAAVIAVQLLGCDTPTCFKEIKRGQQYRVHVVRTYEPNSPFYLADLDNISEAACGDIDGIEPGASFPFWVGRRLDTNICEEYAGVLRPENQPVPGVKLLLTGPHATNAVAYRNILILALQGGYAVETDAGCSGSWSFAIKSANGSFFQAPAENEPPGLLLERTFIPLGEHSEICSRCSDTFVAYLEKL